MRPLSTYRLVARGGTEPAPMHRNVFCLTTYRADWVAEYGEPVGQWALALRRRAAALGGSGAPMPPPGGPSGGGRFLTETYAEKRDRMAADRAWRNKGVSHR